jgi:signal transduction histidine kinase
MNSSLRSKLFLISYGTILAFIAGLIIFNNTILRSYYSYRKNIQLIETFDEYKDLNINFGQYENQMRIIESTQNVSIQVIYEPSSFDMNASLEELIADQSLYQRLYGSPYTINRTAIVTIIYDYHHQLNDILNDDIDINDEAYEAYRFELSEDHSLIGLFVVDRYNSGYIYYFNTITTTSISENIWIFNSFTVVIGLFFMVLSAIVMYLISYRLTSPIIEINRVANDIANLDFSHKVENIPDDEIGDLAISVNKMSDELKNNIEALKVSNQRLAEEILYKNEVEKKRKEFIGSASHELKTPLSLIMGYAEALKLEDISQEDKDVYLEIIIDETEKMNKLVREMLNMNQIENGVITINKTRFNVKDLVNSTINLLSIKLNEKEIDVHVDVSDMDIESDYDQLQTVLINFINNALNHMKSPNKLSIYTEKIDQNQLRVYVYNTGETIPEEDIDYLWNSFYKVDKARTRAYGGHGLGLAICRSIFVALDYEYGVKNMDDGVAFYFDIKC